MMTLEEFSLDRYNIKGFMALVVENEEYVTNDVVLTIDKVLEMCKAKVVDRDMEVEIYSVAIEDKRDFLEWLTSMIKAGKIKVTGVDLPKGKRTIQIDEIAINGIRYSFEELINIVEGLTKMDFGIRYIIVPANKDYPLMIGLKSEYSNTEKVAKYFGVVLAPRT